MYNYVRSEYDQKIFMLWHWLNTYYTEYKKIT